MNLPTPLVSSYSRVNYLQTSYRTSRRFYVKMADYLAGPSTSFENENVIENQQCAPDSKKLCKVCSAPAGKHIYYGARTCISCRGKEFYRFSNVWILTWDFYTRVRPRFFDQDGHETMYSSRILSSSNLSKL